MHEERTIASNKRLRRYAPNNKKTVIEKPFTINILKIHIGAIPCDKGFEL